MPAIAVWRLLPRPVCRRLLLGLLGVVGACALLITSAVVNGNGLNGGACASAQAASLELNPTPGQVGFTPTPAEEQNAAAIVREAAWEGLAARAAVIAVATSMQEHGLQSDSPAYVAAHSGGSIGPFQQLPSWGPASVRDDPAQSADLFYHALVTRPGWATAPLGAIAQAVQRSSDTSGDLYARYENAAAQLVAQLEASDGISLGATACAAVSSGAALPTVRRGEWVTSPLVNVDITRASTAGVVVSEQAVFSNVPAGGYDTKPFPAGQCTWWAAYNRPIYPRNPMGNGGQWYQTAIATGHAVSKQPSVGAWAVWSTGLPGSGGDGHVAIVIAVAPQGTQFEVSEMNEKGRGIVDQRIASVSDPYLLGFVPL